MTAHKKRKKSNTNNNGKIKSTLLPLTPYLVGGLVLIFLIYRLVVLISFKVDCSKVPTDMLSSDNSIINTLFVFQQEESIVNMEVITYSQGQKKVLRVNIPTSTYVTHEGVDSFPISSIKSVGEFLEHGSGKEFTVNYMSDLLGLKFDNYIWLVESSGSTDQFLSKLSVWSILFNFQYNKELHGNLYSNLPILNLIKEVNLINQSLAGYQYEEMDVLECCVEQSILSGDRKEVRFSKGKYDDEFSGYIKELVSKEIEQERVNVEVYNASDVSGLASEYARKIRHTGCRILRFDNAPSIYSDTVIYVPEPEEYKNSLNLVHDVVGEGIQVRYERPNFITTGDIVVVLGTDLVK
jgi:hypothetical protein